MTYFPDTASGTATSGMSDVGALSISDIDVVERSTLDYSTTLGSLANLARSAPVTSRSTVLPAVLTASDNDTTVILTGGSGSLTFDSTIGDGFRCRVLNAAGASAVLPWTTTVPTGSSARLLAVGSSLFSVIAGSIGSGGLFLGAPIDAATFATVL